MGIELLTEEARTFGAKVEFQAGQEKKASEKAKEAVKSRKKSAREAAKKSEDAAAVLDATLADIDVDAQAERTRRRTKVPAKLALPDIKSKIVVRPGPSPTAPPTVARLCREAEKADGAFIRADAHAVAARRCAEKMQAQVDSLRTTRLLQSAGGALLMDDEA